ncbi:MAG: hypothetical protein LBT33_01075 [Spirochaetia bacterium]|jgi:hypothetical protein|nr:hypothetical protein [Spirochaetia bacterium]
MKRCLFLLILCWALAAGARAADFGLVLNPEGEYVSDPAGEGFGFTAGVKPWLSAALGETLGLYLSGKLTLEYEYETQSWADPFLAELERTELNFRPASWVYLVLGRQFYRDGGGMIASGFFDGLSASLSLGQARLFLGGFYSGFQYKESAEILMTREDRDNYARPLDYDDPDTYFASRRVIVPLGLDFPGLFSRASFSLGGLAQIDVNKEPAQSLHTHYLEAQIGLEALDSLRLSLAGVGARMDFEDDGAKRSFAAAFGLDWDLPGALRDMLSAELRWGGGAVDGKTGPFMPVSSIAQGTVFKPGLSGLMDARAFYTMRPHESLSVSLGAVAFWRTDLETFTDAELDPSSKDRFLGTEASATLIWALDSALRLNAGGGAFLPGGAFAEDAAPRWEARAGLALSL